MPTPLFRILYADSESMLMPPAAGFRYISQGRYLLTTVLLGRNGACFGARLDELALDWLQDRHGSAQI